MPAEPEFCIIETTCGDFAVCKTIRTALVEGKLAACVDIGPPQESMYPWDTPTDTAIEYPIRIKTRFNLYSQVEAKILELHPYEVPQILAFPVIAGYSRYLDWLRQNTREKSVELSP